MYIYDWSGSGEDVYIDTYIMHIYMKNIEDTEDIGTPISFSFLLSPQLVRRRHSKQV